MSFWIRNQNGKLSFLFYAAGHTDKRLYNVGGDYARVWRARVWDDWRRAWTLLVCHNDWRLPLARERSKDTKVLHNEELQSLIKLPTVLPNSPSTLCVHYLFTHLCSICVRLLPIPCKMQFLLISTNLPSGFSAFFALAIFHFLQDFVQISSSPGCIPWSH